MATTHTTARSLFDDSRLTQLGDAEGITWDDRTLCIALNQAISLLLTMRPDATLKRSIIELDEDSRQQLPEDGLKLIKVIRNINGDGSIGQAIRVVQMDDLNSIHALWHTAKGNVIHEYCFDPLSPKTFYVYPSPSTGVLVRIEIEYCALPAQINEQNLDELLPFDAIFDQAVIELMLYKLLSGDNQQGRNNTQHYQNAMSILQVQGQNSGAISPIEREM